jgi:hypothetical protein
VAAWPEGSTERQYANLVDASSRLSAMRVMNIGAEISYYIIVRCTSVVCCGGTDAWRLEGLEVVQVERGETAQKERNK